MVKYFISQRISSQMLIKYRIQFSRGSSNYVNCVDVFLEDENARLKAAWDTFGV